MFDAVRVKEVPNSSISSEHLRNSLIEVCTRLKKSIFGLQRCKSLDISDVGLSGVLRLQMCNTSGTSSIFRRHVYNIQDIPIFLGHEHRDLVNRLCADM